MELADSSSPSPVAVEPNPLIPNGIEQLILRCVVCSNEVPRKRATGRSRNTCSKECNAVYRSFRTYLVRSMRCPACYHPSTPDERKDFREWRKNRGDIRAKKGRPPNQDKARSEAFTIGWLKAIDAFVEMYDPVGGIAEPQLGERFKSALASYLTKGKTPNEELTTTA